jgi:hypothetical protein
MPGEYKRQRPTREKEWRAPYGEVSRPTHGWVSRSSSETYELKPPEVVGVDPEGMVLIKSPGGRYYRVLFEGLGDQETAKLEEMHALPMRDVSAIEDESSNPDDICPE